MIHEEDIKWKFVCSWNLKTKHHTVLRDNELGLQRESLTNKTDGGYGIGKSRSFYYIDNDPREFLTVTELVDAYNEKFKFSDENPEHEVKYIRVVVKKPTNQPPH